MSGAALPGVLVEIAAVAGEPAAVLIAGRFGGQRVYIPARVSDTHWLVECVGRAAADKICAHFAVDGKVGARVDIPLYTSGAYASLRRAVAQRLHQLDREGLSSREQAAAVGVTQRTVHNHRRSHRGEKKKGSGQGQLF